MFYFYFQLSDWWYLLVYDLKVSERIKVLLKVHKYTNTRAHGSLSSYHLSPVLENREDRHGSHDNSNCKNGATWQKQTVFVDSLCVFRNVQLFLVWISVMLQLNKTWNSHKHKSLQPMNTSLSRRVFISTLGHLILQSVPLISNCITDYKAVLSGYILCDVFLLGSDFCEKYSNTWLWSVSSLQLFELLMKF